MKLDNFTTARCSKCHWIKQFQPGKEYDVAEFECNCGKPVPEPKPKRKPTKPKQQTMEESSGESKSTTEADSES